MKRLLSIFGNYVYQGGFLAFILAILFAVAIPLHASSINDLPGWARVLSYVWCGDLILLVFYYFGRMVYQKVTGKI